MTLAKGPGPSKVPRAVWKYPFTLDDIAMSQPLEIHTHEPGKILSVGIQQGRGYPHVCVWALVDPAAAKVIRRLIMTGTGHLRDIPDSSRFVGTVFIDDVGLMLHVFELEATNG